MLPLERIHSRRLAGTKFEQALSYGIRQRQSNPAIIPMIPEGLETSLYRSNVVIQSGNDIGAQAPRPGREYLERLIVVLPSGLRLVAASAECQLVAVRVNEHPFLRVVVLLRFRVGDWLAVWPLGEHNPDLQLTPCHEPCQDLQAGSHVGVARLVIVEVEPAKHRTLDPALERLAAKDCTHVVFGEVGPAEELH